MYHTFLGISGIQQKFVGRYLFFFTPNTVICDLQARADMGFVSTFTGPWSDLELLIQAAPRETVETDIYAGKVGARVWTKALTQLSQGDI